eukprot:Selendium_serpulae@DN2229_c0_g1_i3.p3
MQSEWCWCTHCEWQEAGSALRGAAARRWRVEGAALNALARSTCSVMVDESGDTGSTETNGWLGVDAAVRGDAAQSSDAERGAATRGRRRQAVFVGKAVVVVQVRAGDGRNYGRARSTGVNAVRVVLVHTLRVAGGRFGAAWRGGEAVARRGRGVERAGEVDVQRDGGRVGRYRFH